MMEGEKEADDQVAPHRMIINHIIGPVIETFKSEVCEELYKESVNTLDTVLQLVSSFAPPKEKTAEHQQAFLCIIKEACFPALNFLTLLPDQSNVKSDRKKALSTITQLLLESCSHVERGYLIQTVTELLLHMCSVVHKQEDTNILYGRGFNILLAQGARPLNLLLSLELANSLFVFHDVFEEYLSAVDDIGLQRVKVLSFLYETLLLASEEDDCFAKALTVLPKLFPYFDKHEETKHIENIWKLYTKVGESQGPIHREQLWKCLFVFYCMKDFFFPLDKSGNDVLGARMTNKFWRIVQAGLASAEPSQRKLSMYLFKRLIDTCNTTDCQTNTGQQTQSPIFWWSSKSAKHLMTVWEDFTLLIETLEEKQVHVIKPVLPRMQKLIVATSTTSEEGLRYFHSSWLVTVVTRCFQHESHYMSRWGAYTLLTMDFKAVPLVEHGQLQFLSQDLLEFLQENRLYSRYEGTELGHSSPVGEALKGFFDNLLTTFTKDQKMKYLQNVFQMVCDNKWGSIPLVFLFQGLGHIRQDQILNRDHLKLIRHILRACLTTLETMTRGAIQCFVCQMVTRLLDLNAVSVWDYFDTLGFLDREESLRRGTILWTGVVDWLSSVQHSWSSEEVTTKALDFLKGSDADQDSSIIFEGYEVIGIARMLVLRADMEKSTKLPVDVESKALSPMAKVLLKVSEIMSNIRNRPYINTAQVDRCLSLVFSLCKELSNGSHSAGNNLLSKHLTGNIGNTSHYIQHRLLTDLTKASDLEEIKSYSDVLLAFGVNAESVQPLVTDLVNFVNKAGLEDQKSSTNHSVIGMSCLRILATVFKILARHPGLEGKREFEYAKVGFQLLFLVLDVPLPFSKKNSNSQAESAASTSNAQVGRVIGRFLSSKWQCIVHLLKSSKGHIEESGPKQDKDQQQQNSIPCQCIVKAGRSLGWGDLLQEAMEDMSIGSGSSDIAIFQGLACVADELVSSVPGEDIAHLLELSWAKVMEEKKNILFWRKLEALVTLALSTAFVKQGLDTDVGAAVDQFLSKVSMLGEEKTGINNLVYSHLCGQVLHNDPERSLATRLAGTLKEACFFGTVHKKGERLWLDVCAYIESLGNRCTINQITSSISRNDLFARVIVLDWLSTLSPSEPADCRFAREFISSLRSTYIDLAAQTTYKQFSNSLYHRQKHRMAVALLILDDFVEETETATYLPFLWRALELECHPSVRHCLEWMVLRLLHRFPQHADCLWDVFKLYDTKRSVSLCSLFPIVSHLGGLLQEQQQVAFYQNALTVVIPWTMAHHYNTRIFAQTTLICLWEQCKALGLSQVMDHFSVVEASLHFLYKNNNASDTALKLKANYIYSGFDPVRDYSMESILYTLPRLACIADDEWILPEQLVQWNTSWEKEGGCHHIPLRNLSPVLAQCKAGPWRSRGHAENDDTFMEYADGDVQKKIMPWRQMTPDQETEVELASQRHRKAEGGLVLVTSLLDKLPNIGGLCRTSEIFGVSEFVVGNLTHLNDRMFQTLSVSAQKWITITEVLRHYLVAFLQEKREQGYTLVGVEQTANSVSLQDYQFPKKTLLLLGNEKAGIPVNILQLLDVAVEIPQLGVIRSLNVHVCGALIVWEYTRQQMQRAQAQT